MESGVENYHKKEIYEKNSFLIESKEIKLKELDREDLLKTIYDLSDQSSSEVPLYSKLE